MIWEDKVKLIDLSNKSKTEFLKYTISKLGEFDDQALQMFLTSVELDEGSILDDIDLHLEIYNSIKDEEVSDLRCAIRLSVYEMIIQSYKNDNKEI